MPHCQASSDLQNSQKKTKTWHVSGTTELSLRTRKGTNTINMNDEMPLQIIL